MNSIKEDAPKRILIVEDAKDIQTLLTRLLKGAGYSVTCASNGYDALKILGTGDELPGLILLDLMMPDMDGFQFRAAQESDSRLAEVPIVAMTAYGDVESKAMQVGAKAYLKKPFSDIDTILKTVEKFFRTRD